MRSQRHSGQLDPPTDLSQPTESPEEDSDQDDLDDFDHPCTDVNDLRWDVFIPDDDERDPLPEAGDFWVDDSQSTNS
jgi:hypothetical protein